MLSTKLQSLNTHPQLIEALLTRLQQWRYEQPYAARNWDVEVSQCLLEQDEIGWKNMMEGLPSKKWQIIQNKYYQSIQSQKSGRRWILSVFKLLANMAWDQWEHRNAILHKHDQPRHQRALQLLHQEILAELAKGSRGLNIHDQYHFNVSFLTLRSKSLDYIKAWLLNVQAARKAASERQIRNAQAREEFFVPLSQREHTPPQMPHQRQRRRRRNTPPETDSHNITTWIRTGYLY